MKNLMLGGWLVAGFFILFSLVSVHAQKGEYYEVRTYHLSSQDQIEAMDEYLSKAYLPTLHKKGFKNVGVFKLIGNDTAQHKKIFVLTHSSSVDKLLAISDMMVEDRDHQMKGKTFWMASHDQAPYDRLEVTILKSFELAPKLVKPSLSTPDSEQVFELRSYEGATEKLYRKKVEMFNKGGEIELFNELDFNAVFYGEVVVGAHMPNLMYMTSFINMDDRNKHWDAFRVAPAWKVLSAKEEYKNTVSKNNTYLLHPTSYSDL